MCGFQSEYRKCKRPFPPTARAHLVADPAPPEATFQPFSRPRGSRGRLAGRPLSAPRSEAAPWGSLAPGSSPHLPSYRVPGRHRGSPLAPPNRLQPPPPSHPSRAGCPSPAIGSVRALRASLRPAGCRQGCASRWRAGVAGDGLRSAESPRCSRAGRAPGRQREAGGQTRARAPREGDKGARGGRPRAVEKVVCISYTLHYRGR